MKFTSKRVLALLTTLTMLVSLFSGLSLLSVQAATVDYVYSGDYVYNWGVRDTLATFLSPMAEDFYTDNNVTYDDLASLSGSANTDSVPDSALYLELQDLMVANHGVLTRYDDTKEMYQYTDCQNSAKTSNKISSFYSGAAVGPEWDSGSTWNREHTWPNSKGLDGRDEDDIMMLRPTASSENSSRSNTAYGESSSYYDPNGLGQNLRGDVARIMLYQYVRWGNAEYMWGASGVMESKAVLLKWMEEDPVDTWELGRNDAVEFITGTRNVFVDYPELAFVLFDEDVPADYDSPSGGVSASYTVSASSNNTAYGTVSVSGRTVTATPKTGYEVSGYTLLSGTATVTRDGNVFRVVPSTDVSIRVNFSKRSQATVEFSQLGVIAHSQTAYVGDVITLPAHSGAVSEGYTFVGWVEQTVEDTTVAPVVYTAGSTYTVAAGRVLYALYSRFEGTGSGNVYELYSGAITEGDYVIVYDKEDYRNQAMVAALTSSSTPRLNYTDIVYENGNVVDPDAAAIWHIVPDGNYWALYNAQTNTYAGGTGSKNQAKPLEELTDYALWTVSGTETYEFVNKGNNANSVNANLRRNGTYGFACYSTSTGGALTLYKCGSGTRYFFTGAACNHNFAAATCTAPKTCTLCGVVEGEALGHTYDNDYDTDCNVCGAVRIVAYDVLAFDGRSLSTDVNGVAFRYVAQVSGMTLEQTQGDYSAATITPTSALSGVRLVMMGAVVSNKASSSLTIENAQPDLTVVVAQAVYFMQVTEQTAAYAVRVVDIPEEHKDKTIYARPYYIYEDADGNEIVCYGTVESASYNDLLSTI